MVLRVVSVVLAVVIWIILSITLFPTIYITVYEVPVKLELTGSEADANGLSAVNFTSAKVDVQLSGMRYEIGNYKADDLVATLDLSSVTKNGTYDLDVIVRSAHDDKCNVTSVSPSTVRVTFDNIKSIELPAEVDYSGISAAEGYTLKSPTVVPEKVKVTGPEGEISKIEKAVISVNGDYQHLTESFTTDDTQVALYNKDGVAVNQTNLTFSEEKYAVTFPIYMEKTVPFSLSIQQCPDNFDQSILKYSFDPETITILSSGDISDITSHNAGYVFLNQIDLEQAFSFDIELDNGQINDSGIDKVNVTFDKTGFASKNFTLTAEHIKVLDPIPGKKIEVRTEKIANVKMIGPAEDIKKLKASDLVAEYDMEGSQFENGSYQSSVRIYSPKVNTVWCVGNYDIIIAVSDK